MKEEGLGEAGKGRQTKGAVVLGFSYPVQQSRPVSPEVSYETGGVCPLQNMVLCRLVLL